MEVIKSKLLVINEFTLAALTCHYLDLNTAVLIS